MCASLQIITIKSQHKDINRNNAAKVLEKSLKEAGISFHDNDFKGWTAHHIVAYEASDADYSRKVLEALDIDLNSAANGVFLPNDLSKEDVISESRHNGGHLKSYYEYVNDEIKDALELFDSRWRDNDNIGNILKDLPDKQKAAVRAEICNTLQDIKLELLEGNLKIHNT